MAELRSHTKLQSKNQKGRDHFEYRGENGRMILIRILKEQGQRVWTEFIWIRMGSSGASVKHRNELTGVIKGGTFLTD
jgi:hypothetical protein